MIVSAFIAASMLSVSGLAYAKAPITTYPPAWGQQSERQVRPRVTDNMIPAKNERRSFHRHLVAKPRGPSGGGTVRLTPSVTQLQADVLALRRELAAVREQIGRPPLEKPRLAPSFLELGLWGLARPPEKPAGTLFLPSLGLASPPSEPPPLPFLARLEVEAADRVREATLYLIKTATVGVTMARQSPEVALGRLHPDFRVKLAEAIKRAREAGLEHAGVFSAYRPPIFGIGGFSDKFNSLHSYGLAADVAGIGSPGSKPARTWQKIVNAVGLFLPYGAANRSEFNHTQLISSKIAAKQLRGTITAREPKDLPSMWAASGDTKYVKEEARALASAKLLPEVDWVQ